jgi:DNA repair exonuclease SbcCD ATPase subunit
MNSLTLSRVAQRATLLALIALGSVCVQTVQSQEANSAIEELQKEQKALATQYANLEEVFLRMSQLEGATNPTRAALLMQAAQMSKQMATQQRMSQASDLLAKGQYSRAIPEQEASRENLKKLLELLQSENRSSRIKDERKRLEDVLKDIRRIENIQRATRGRTEAGQDKDSAAEDQKDLEKQLETAENDLGEKGDKGEKGEKGEKGDKSGKQEKTDPSDPSDPTDPSGKQEKTDPSDPTDPSGKQEKTDPSDPTDPSGKQEKTDPSDPSDPTDPSGKQEKSTQGEKSNKPPSKEEQAKERVQKARERMQKAEKNLRAEKRKEAIEEQQQAEEELQQAIAELEKILMQLREEEIERTLVDLETRLKRMSEWETTIRQATEKLEKLSGEDKDRQLEIQASKLSTEQLKVAMEGQRAMLLLKDEGSSQAFPEALEQVIADAQLVVNRLVASDVSVSTQSIQDEILGALDEMIESLQEVQKKRDEKKQQNQRQGPSDSGGQQQEESLVGKIAELRLIKTLQMRVNRRTGRLADESNQGEDLIGQVTDSRLQEELRELAKRQEKIQSVTRDILLEAAKQ